MTEAGDDDSKVDVEALERDRLREREKILIKKCKQMNSEIDNIAYLLFMC
jgi:hypothetical protein